MPTSIRPRLLAIAAGTSLAVMASVAVATSSAAASSEAATPSASAPRSVARAIVDELATAFSRDFVYPDVGDRYAAMLRTNAAAGAYDALTGAALADRLTADLQAVQQDGHVRVRAAAPAAEAASRAPAPNAPPATAPSTAPAGTPAGGTPPPADTAPRIPPQPWPNIEAGRWLAPGIAFVRFNLMASEPADAAAADRFMAEHADAKVVIFDLRTNNGGGLAEMDAVFPYLFARPTPLVRMATRRSVFEREGAGPMGDLPSLKPVDGDPAFVTREHWATPNRETRLRGARVYVLTSGRTASAAEHFCLAMKATKRATLVGEPTAGGNHFGYGMDLPGGLEAFIPVGRTFDPATGKDWEGVGVLPDVAVSKEEALIRVLEREGIATEKATQLSSEVAPKKPMERRRTVV